MIAAQRTAKYKHNLGNSKGLKNMITKYCMREKAARNSGKLIPNDFYAFLSNYFKCKAYTFYLGLQSFPGEVHVYYTM
jgi:hypothetical protein